MKAFSYIASTAAKVFFGADNDDSYSDSDDEHVPSKPLNTVTTNICADAESRFSILNNYYGKPCDNFLAMHYPRSRFIKHPVKAIQLNISIPLQTLTSRDNEPLKINLKKMMKIDPSFATELAELAHPLNTDSNNLYTRNTVYIEIQNVMTNLPVSHDFYIDSEYNTVKRVKLTPVFSKDDLSYEPWKFSLQNKQPIPSMDTAPIIYSATEKGEMHYTFPMIEYGPTTIKQLIELASEYVMNGTTFIKVKKTLMSTTVYYSVHEKHSISMQYPDNGDHTFYLFHKEDWLKILDTVSKSLIPTNIYSFNLSIRPSFYPTWSDAISSEETSEVVTSVKRLVDRERYIQSTAQNKSDDTPDQQYERDSIHNSYKLRLVLVLTSRRI